MPTNARSELRRRLRRRLVCGVGPRSDRAPPRRHGSRVEEDLSVTGWDNTSLRANLQTALTTVDVNHAELGRRAMNRLLDAIGGNPLEPVDSSAPSNTILWRTPTEPPPAVKGASDRGA